MEDNELELDKQLGAGVDTNTIMNTTDVQQVPDVAEAPTDTVSTAPTGDYKAPERKSIIENFDYDSAIYDSVSKGNSQHYADDIVGYLESVAGEEYDFNKARQSGYKSADILREVMMYKQASEIPNDFVKGMYKGLTNVHLLLADVAQATSEGVEKATGYDFLDDNAYAEFIQTNQQVATILKNSIEDKDFFSMATAGEVVFDLASTGATPVALTKKLMTWYGAGIANGVVAYRHSRETNTPEESIAPTARGVATGVVAQVGLGFAGKVVKNTIAPTVSDWYKMWSNKYIAPSVQKDVLDDLEAKYINTTPLLKDEFTRYYSTFKESTVKEEFASESHRRGMAVVNFLSEQKPELIGYVKGSMKTTDTVYGNRARRAELIQEKAGIIAKDSNNNIYHLTDEADLHGIASDIDTTSRIVKQNHEALLDSIDMVKAPNLSRHIDDELVKYAQSELQTGTLGSIKKDLKDLTADTIEDMQSDLVDINTLIADKANISTYSMRKVLDLVSDVSAISRRTSVKQNPKLSRKLDEVKKAMLADIDDSLIQQFGKVRGTKKIAEMRGQMLDYAKMKHASDSKLGSILYRLNKAKTKGKNIGDKQNYAYVVNKLLRMDIGDTLIQDMTSMIGSKKVSKIFSHMIDNAITKGNIDSIHKLQAMIETKSATPEIKGFVDTLNKFKLLFNDDLEHMFTKDLDNSTGNRSDVKSQIMSMFAKPAVNLVLKHLPYVKDLEVIQGSVQQDFVTKVFRNPVTMKKVVSEIESMPPTIRSKFFEKIAVQIPHFKNRELFNSDKRIEFLAGKDGVRVIDSDDVAGSFGLDPTITSSAYSRSARQKLAKDGIKDVLRFKSINDEVLHWATLKDIADFQHKVANDSLEFRGYTGSIKVDSEELTKIANSKILQEQIRHIQAIVNNSKIELNDAGIKDLIGKATIKVLKDKTLKNSMTSNVKSLDYIIKETIYDTLAKVGIQVEKPRQYTPTTGRKRGSGGVQTGMRIQ